MEPKGVTFNMSKTEVMVSERDSAPATTWQISTLFFFKAETLYSVNPANSGYIKNTA